MKCVSSFTSIALLLVAASAIHTTQALKAYLSNLPNGALFTQPLGHPDSDETQFTDFATAFAAVDKTWTTEFCKATFPGSTMTNGAAFGDPCCTWKKGDTAPQTVTAFTTTPTKATTCATAETPAPAATTATPAATTATPVATTATPAATTATPAATTATPAATTAAPAADASASADDSSSASSAAATTSSPAASSDDSSAASSSSSTPAPAATTTKPSSGSSSYSPGKVIPGGKDCMIKNKGKGGKSKGNKGKGGKSKGNKGKSGKGKKFRGSGSGSEQKAAGSAY